MIYFLPAGKKLCEAFLIQNIVKKITFNYNIKSGEETKNEIGEINMAQLRPKIVRLAKSIGCDGRVSALKVEAMELGEPVERGRHRPVGTGRFETIELDSVTAARSRATTRPRPRPLPMRV